MDSTGDVMIIGRHFVWGHIGKTGGDATRMLFDLFPDLIVAADDISDPRKHDTFRARGILPDAGLFALNIRRLPCWVVSFVNHVKDTHVGYTLPPSSLLCRARLPDRLIANYTDHGQYPIHRWLRMEYLREDVQAFIHEKLRPISDHEAVTIRHCETNPPRDYDHNIYQWFTRKEVEQLYAHNPLWREIEQRVYGDLLLDGIWQNPWRKACDNLRLQAEAAVLDRVIRTRKRRAIRSGRNGLRRALMIEES